MAAKTAITVLLSGEGMAIAREFRVFGHKSRNELIEAALKRYAELAEISKGSGIDKVIGRVAETQTREIAQDVVIKTLMELHDKIRDSYKEVGVDLDRSVGLALLRALVRMDGTGIDDKREADLWEDAWYAVNQEPTYGAEGG
jgi:hypothetical protein